MLKDARNIPSVKSNYYRNLNTQILGGIIESLRDRGPLEWSYHVYGIKTRKPIYSQTLRDRYPMW
jgi:hypothetical protein